MPCQAKIDFLMHHIHTKSWTLGSMTGHRFFLVAVAETLEVALFGTGYGDSHQLHFPDPNMLDKMLLTTGFFCVPFGSSVPAVLVL